MYEVEAYYSAPAGYLQNKKGKFFPLVSAGEVMSKCGQIPDFLGDWDLFKFKGTIEAGV